MYTDTVIQTAIWAPPDWWWVVVESAGGNTASWQGRRLRMLELRFRTKQLRERCGVHDQMVARWGEARAERVGLRLQQLAAMTSTRDVSFLPCESSTDADGRIHVAVDDSISLVVSARHSEPAERDSFAQILIIEDVVESETNR